MICQFDRVPHDKLVEKLDYAGVDRQVTFWVRAHSLEAFSGVPQESVWGLFLFLAYINDIVDELDPELTIKLFADDCHFPHNV